MIIVAVRVKENKIEIASDSITVSGYTQRKDGNAKLVQVNGFFVGSVGLAEESGLMQVFCTTHCPEDATESGIINFIAEFADWKRKKTNVFAIENSYVFVIGNHAFEVEGFYVGEVESFAAIGAGRDFALAALHLGHNVKKAVEVACELSVFCETPILVFEVRKVK